MGTQHVLVLDEGTTSTRAVLFDDQSQVVSSIAEPLNITTHPDGRVEQDAQEIWEKSARVLRQVVDHARENSLEIAALGMAIQRTTTVLWDRATGEPVAPVISWQDTRAADTVAELGSDWARKSVETSGLVLGSANCGLHLQALLNADPDLRRRAEAGELLAGTVDTWIIWKLTGRFLTSTSCAGSSGMGVLRSATWWSEFLEELQVPLTLLPEILDEDADFGRTNPDHIGADLPVTGVFGDQQSALFGQGGFAPGSVKCTHGTGSFIDFNIGANPIVPASGLDCRVAWTTKGTTTYLIEGGSFVTGSGIDWLVSLGMLDKAANLDATYAQGDPDSGLVCVPALAGFTTPHWDGNARGLLIGFHRGSTSQDMVRATVDGIAHTVTDVLEAMAESAGVSPRVINVDGGLARSGALLQAQADLMQIPVVRAAQAEYITARGAAWCAGVVHGVWASADAASATQESGVTFDPQTSSEVQGLCRQAWQDAVGRDLGWRRTVLR
ncbi:FGGY family carbohydrate kinase [Propionibacteriaceae bacterium Y1923]|uniref:FGGY family carbohydrate kinase n=1 Tax=Aestuariimicrobium sp. Y1814 TaxID=3418742 RepID=UPI003C294569